MALHIGIGLFTAQVPPDSDRTFAQEYRMFGIPISERVRRTAETIEILRRAWTGRRFSYEGKIFHLDRVLITPAPAQEGGPPIWLGGSVEPAISRAGRLADGYIRTRGGDAEKMRADLQIVEEAARAAGRDPASLAFAQLQNTFVRDDGDAWEIAGRYVGNQLGIYRGWDAGGDTPEKGFVLDPPEEATMRWLTPAGT